MRVAITGAAGLVGQNLIPRLLAFGHVVTAIDKNKGNLSILQDLHKQVTSIESDLADEGAWEDEIKRCDALIMLHAQIGGTDARAFERNNITATERVLAAAKSGSCRYVVHVSSSAVKSKVVDCYTESKKAQEALVQASGLKHVTLRPTLMFGWFDRKHLGWLARFMQKSPIFPIPGHGRYLRQPLYAGDFASIVAASLSHETTGSYDISGLERIDFIDLIRLIREVKRARCVILNIPYPIFQLMLDAYRLFDSDPPFTSSQLKALATPDIFEEINWPTIFGVSQTPLRRALEETFLDPVWSNVVLEF